MISYLQTENLARRFGNNLLFGNINLNINRNDKIAIIAVNGAGKSSLLDIIAGKESPDGGSISLKRDLKIAYLEQTPVLNESNTILDELFSTGSDLVNVIRKYEASLLSGDEESLQEMIIRMENAKAWDYEVAVKQILTQLQLPDLNASISTLSGGQRKRVALAKVLVEESDLLILDEPTNHLDLEMIEWLEDYLIRSSKSILMVTHDRYFLERVCNIILELSDKKLYRFEGNYEYFIEKKQERETAVRAGAEKARNLLKTELDWMRRMPSARRHKAKSRIDSFYELKDRASKQTGEKSVDINVNITRLGKKILEIRNVSKSYGEKKLIRNFSYVFSRFEKVGLIGDNGVGKTTLLNIMTGSSCPDSGTVEKGDTVVFGYYKQLGEVFDDDMTVLDAAKKIAEEVTVSDGKTLSVTQFLNLFLFPPEKQNTFIRKLSGGEKRRLYLLTVLMKNPNFLILDEPTNDLDILTLNVLEEYLAGFRGCVVVVSHDRYFMDKVVDHIFENKGNGIIRDFPGNYSNFREKQLEEQRITADIKPVRQTNTVRKGKENGEKPRKAGLTFMEKRELDDLTDEINRLEAEKAALESEMNSGLLSGDDIFKRSLRHVEIMKLLDDKEIRWFGLSEKM